MITSRITFDVEKARTRLGAMAQYLHPTLVAAMRSFVQTVAKDTVVNKLSGQVLNKVTGNLQRAVIASQRTFGKGDAIIGSVGVSRLSYGVWHEQGYSGPETVHGHTVKAHSRSTRFGIFRVRSHYVREHVRQRHIRARRFIETTLREDIEFGTKRFHDAVAILVRTGKPPTASMVIRNSFAGGWD